jgi:CysZ protein
VTSNPFAAAFHGLGDLLSRELRGLVGASMLLAAVLLGASVWAVIRFLVPLVPDWAGWWGGAAEMAASGALILLVIALALALWPLVAMVVSGLFADVAADRLEARLLPEGQRGKAPGPAAGLMAGLRFAAVSLPLNLLALPLYFIPVVNLFVAAGLNAFLFSRENWMLASLRHEPWPQAHASLRQHRPASFLAGLLPGAVCLLPVLNLTVPLWTLATMIRLRAGLATAPARPT